MLNNLSKYGENTERMPVVFVGHGSPMNAIEDNEFSRSWQKLSQNILQPKAILCVSAHWETYGTSVTAPDFDAGTPKNDRMPSDWFIWFKGSKKMRLCNSQSELVCANM